LRAADGQASGGTAKLDESEGGYSVQDDDDEEAAAEEDDEDEEANAALEEEAQRRADLEEQGRMCRFVTKHLAGAVKELRARGLLKGAGRGGASANEVSVSALVRALQAASASDGSEGCPHAPFAVAALVCGACGFAVDGPEQGVWDARVDVKALKEHVEECLSDVEALLEEEP
jgi:hypothetical protein